MGFSLLMVLVNLLFNIMLNQWWAGGSWILIFNSFYLMLQTMLSWPLIFEIPLFINTLRFLRTFSVAIAVFYNLVYVFIAVDWAYMLWGESDATFEQYDFISICTNMFLAYNIIFNIHILPVNMMIILKEITLDLFPPMLEQDSDEGLNLQDAEDTVKPLSWWDMITGKSLPDQEQAYNINKKK